jgi:hypothetical protein
VLERSACGSDERVKGWHEAACASPTGWSAHCAQQLHLKAACCSERLSVTRSIGAGVQGRNNLRTASSHVKPIRSPHSPWPCECGRHFGVVVR